MSTVQHRALHVTTPRSCLELGVCQGRTPSCSECTHAEDAKALAASVQASRNTGCCSILGDEDFRESLSPMKRIAYWASVGAAVGLTVAAVFGTAGYLSVKALGL